MNVYEYICLDIWKIIFEYCDFISKIRLSQVCTLFYKNLHITDFCNIEYKYKNKLTDDILKNYKNIIKLNVGYNSKIKDVSWMSNLKELDASWVGIDQNGIKNLNLIKLKVRHNSKIKDVSWMSNLIELHIGGDCGINQNGIKNLNLIKLDAYDNSKINDVSWMNNLRELSAGGGNCGIDQEGIKNLNLIK